jgi:hypothetical protein
MSTQTLRDSRHSIIGYIDTESDETQVGRNASRSIVGYYDPKTNKTKDAHHSIVGEGNLLSSLITSPH